MKCVIYVRVSTEEQAKHGYSIAAQIEKLEAYCISQGWELVQQFVDDGYSAKDLERPRFKEMMHEIEAGGIDVLLVYRLDRLTRSVSDLYKILNELDKHGCKFKSATEVYDTTNAMGRLFITLVAAIAQWERENTAERVFMGTEKKAKLGEWPGGTPPYGYKLENEKLIIDESEAVVVKEIYKGARTFGFYTIAKKLTEKGISPRSSNFWNIDTIRGIANNPVYAGYIRHSEGGKQHKKPPREQILYEGIHERIVDREDFWELQDILDKRRTFGGKRQTSDYYFSSILICARCGFSFAGHKGGSKGKKIKTYRCSGKKSGNDCTSHTFLETKLVEAVFSKLNEIKATFNSNIEQVAGSDERLKELTQELSSVQKLMKKKKTMYENDIIDIDELISSTDSLREHERSLQKEINNIKQQDKHDNTNMKYILENLDDLWELANDQERKELMTSLFDQIVVDTKDEYRGNKYPRDVIIVSYK